MNEFAKMYEQAEKYKAMYPPGTRLLLHYMNDP